MSRRVRAGLELAYQLCGPLAQIDEALVARMRDAGLSVEAMRGVAEVCVHFNFMNRIADAFDFPIPKEKSKRAMAKMLQLLGKVPGRAQALSATRGSDGRLRPPEVESQRRRFLDEGIEVTPVRAAMVERHVTSLRRQFNRDEPFAALQSETSVLSATLASYLKKLALYAYRITDDDFARLRGEGHGDDELYELTLLGSLCAATVGVQELYELLE